MEQKKIARLYWNSESSSRIKENLVIYGKKYTRVKYFIILISLESLLDVPGNDIFYHEIEFKNFPSLKNDSNEIEIGDENKFKEILEYAKIEEKLKQKTTFDRFPFVEEIKQENITTKKTNIETKNGLKMVFRFEVEKSTEDSIEKIEISLDRYNDDQYFKSQQNIDRNSVEIFGFFLGDELMKKSLFDISTEIETYPIDSRDSVIVKEEKNDSIFDLKAIKKDLTESKGNLYFSVFTEQSRNTKPTNNKIEKKENGGLLIFLSLLMTLITITITFLISWVFIDKKIYHNKIKDTEVNLGSFEKI